MKLLTCLFAAAIAIVLALYLAQSRKVASQNEQLAALRAETEQKTAQAEKLEAAQKRNQEQRRELLRQTDELAAQLQARQLAESKAGFGKVLATIEANKSDDGKAGFGKMVAKMMQDPDSKKFIRDQQRMMMNQLYSPLVKQMGLTPEEASQFKDLLSDNAMKAAEKAFSMFDGGLSTNKAELTEAMAAEQKGFDDQVKAYLGDSRYAQYKDYQETAGERTQLNMYKQQTGGDLALSDQQTEQLLAFVKEEKKNVAATTGQPLPGAGPGQAKMEALLSSEKSDQVLQAQETINQRVFERAKDVLSPEQLDSFAKFQTNQIQMLRMSFSMVQKMFTPDKSESASPPAGQ